MPERDRPRLLDCRHLDHSTNGGCGGCNGSFTDSIVLSIFVASIIFAFVLDLLKVFLFGLFKMT
jgi:hypothetical protein